jgi:hypothetical protein
VPASTTHVTLYLHKHERSAVHATALVGGARMHDVIGCWHQQKSRVLGLCVCVCVCGGGVLECVALWSPYKDNKTKTRQGHKLTVSSTL